MKHSAQSFILFSFSVILTFIMVGCSEPTFVGNELVVDGQEFSSDTAVLPVFIYPQREDSIISSSIAGLSAVSLGIINSPYFGKNKSGFFTQLVLAANGIKFPDDAVLDSIVLALDYLAVLGDSTGMHNIEVYEVSEEITRDTVYNTFEYAYESAPLGEKIGHVFNNVDSLYLETDTVQAQFRVKLSDDLGQRFITENADTSSSTFDTNDLFQEWFRGLYITVDDANSTENSMAFFNTNSSTISRMILYYTSDTVSTSFSFPITFACNQHVRIETDYTGTGLESLLAEMPANNIYSVLAPMAGVNTVIEIPELANYSNTIINKAELILPVLPFDDDIDTIYNRPSETTMFWQQDGERIGLIADIAASGTIYNYEGGLVSDDDSGIDFYRMNLALASQEIAEGLRDSTELILYQNPRRAAVRRVLLGGGNHPDPNYRARLNLFYTEIE